MFNYCFELLNLYVIFTQRDLIKSYIIEKKYFFGIFSGIWECTEWVLCNIRIYLCSDPKTGTAPPDYVNKSPDYPVDKRNFVCCTRITWCMWVEVPEMESRNVNFNSGIISGIVPLWKILLYSDPSCPFVSKISKCVETEYRIICQCIWVVVLLHIFFVVFNYKKLNCLCKLQVYRKMPQNGCSHDKRTKKDIHFHVQIRKRGERYYWCNDYLLHYFTNILYKNSWLFQKLHF